jgi:hypothetical protein
VLFYGEHGVTPIKRCLTDIGPAYRSKVFNDSLTRTGTAHKFTRPHTAAHEWERGEVQPDDHLGGVAGTWPRHNVHVGCPV